MSRSSEGNDPRRPPPHAGAEGMSVKPLTQRVLYALPATASELAAAENVHFDSVNCALKELRERGLVRRTERRGIRYGARGRLPSFWERT